MLRTVLPNDVGVAEREHQRQKLHVVEDSFGHKHSPKKSLLGKSNLG